MTGASLKNSLKSAKPAAASVARQTFRIAVLPGDGIGPEVCNAALQVLRHLQPAMPGVRLAFTE